MTAVASIVAGTTGIASNARADVAVWQGISSEDQVKNFAGAPGDGSTDSAATGDLDVRYDMDNGWLYFDISWNGLEADLTKLHVHGPADASMSTMSHVFDIFNEADLGPAGVDLRTDRVVAELPFVAQLTVGAPAFDEATSLQHLFDGLAYVNVHTVDFPMGEIRGNLGVPTMLPTATKDQQKCWNKLAKGYESLLKAQAKQVDYCLKNGTKGDLTAWSGVIGEDQVKNFAGPPGDGSTDSPATGDFRIVLNTKSDDLSYEIAWDDLQSDLTKLHVHGPADASMSTMSHVFDILNEVDLGPAGVDLRSDRIHVTTTLVDQLTVGAPAFEKDVAVQHMLDELAYINVHSTDFPMGEIRGNLVLTSAVDACLFEDFTGKIAKARAKLEDTLAGDCAGGSFPPFGAEPGDYAATAAQAASDAAAGMQRALFGPDIDSALADAGTDKATSKCQLVTAKKVAKCGSTIAKAYTTCANGALKGKKRVAAVDAVALERCVADDPKGKVAKACSEADGALGKIITKKCSGDLAATFPGAGAADVATLLASASLQFTCETCLAFNATYALAADCDLLDDGAVDGSCS